MKRGRLLRTTLHNIVVVACIFFLLEVFTASAEPPKEQPNTPIKAPSPTSQSLPLLVDVGADKCIPCVMMAPILEDLKKEYAGVLTVKFVDVWKNPEEARKYRVRGIPTQIFYSASGVELGRHFGFISKEGILRTFADLGIPLKKPVKK